MRPMAICLFSFENVSPLSSCLELSRGKKRHIMENFPGDVRMAEEKTGGDPDILSRPEFKPESKPNIAGIFGDQTPKLKKSKKGPGRKPRSVSESTDDNSLDATPVRSTKAHPGRFSHGYLLSTSRKSSIDDNKQYKCQFGLCSFSTDRLNVIILHNKTHSNEKAPHIHLSRKDLSLQFSVHLLIEYFCSVIYESL